MIYRLIKLALLGLFLVAVYFSIAPVPVQPVAWEEVRSTGYVGPFTMNERLAGLERHELAGRHGPEDAAVGASGELYIATAEGEVLRRDPRARNPPCP